MQILSEWKFLAAYDGASVDLREHGKALYEIAIGHEGIRSGAQEFALIAVYMAGRANGIRAYRAAVKQQSASKITPDEMMNIYPRSNLSEAVNVFRLLDFARGYGIATDELPAYAFLGGIAQGIEEESRRIIDRIHL